jgi:hypothetical protein
VAVRTSPLAIFGLTLLCASQALAGTTGNGWDQSNGATPAAKPQYDYCFGRAGSKTVYFSSVITSAQSTTGSNLPAAFASYLAKTFGASSNDASCQTFLYMNAAVEDKKNREAKFNSAQWKIVETNWAGAPGAAASVATPPAATANTPTSLPPAAQAIPGAAGAQVNGQIEQAGQRLLNNLFQH